MRLSKIMRAASYALIALAFIIIGYMLLFKEVFVSELMGNARALAESVWALALISLIAMCYLASHELDHVAKSLREKGY